MSSLTIEQVDAVLAYIRGSASTDDIAAQFNVSASEVQNWASEFITAGKEALAGSLEKANKRDLDGVRDRLTAINALNAISQSLSAILNLDELIETTVDNLLWVFGYTATIGLVDGEDIVIKCGYGLDGNKINWYDWRLPINTERSIFGWVASHARPLNIADTSTDPRYVYQEVVGPVRSELAIPMIFKGTVLGILDVKSGSPHAFDQNDMSILETVCFQLAVAVENATLFETVRARARQAELMQGITAKAMENLDVQAIISSAVEMTHEIMGYSGVAIGMIDEQHKTLEVTSLGGVEANFEYFALPVDDSTVIGSAVQLGQMVLANEVTRDERFSLNPLLESSQSELVVPMRSLNKLIGVINVESDKPGAFTGNDVGMLTLMADQLTVAIRSAELREQIERANARFLAVLEATDDGIIVWDDTWRVLFANPAASRMLGIPVSSLIGLSRDGKDMPDQLVKIANAREDERIEFPGDDRCVGRCRNLLWESESATGFLSVIYDITSQVVLEETRADMTSMLVHDLRGPLTSVVSGMEMARLTIEEDNDPPRAVHFLKIGERSGATLLNLINALLDITKLEAGAFSLELNPVEVKSIFDEVMNILEGSLKTARIDMQVEIAEDLPEVMGDNGVLRRALQNLVDNAIKFTPDDGEVKLSAYRQSDKAIRFEVADTGPGVPEAFRKKIFEKYGQIPGQKGRRRGTGLGLAFCKLVAEAHGGRLWVDTRQGGGSVFSLVIGEHMLRTES